MLLGTVDLVVIHITIFVFFMSYWFHDWLILFCTIHML